MAKLKFSYPVFQQPSAVVHGRGSLRSLVDGPALDEAAVFLSGRESVQRRFDELLAKRNIQRASLRVLVKPAGEPTWAMIEQGAAFLCEKPTTRILGLGGGSVLDWCRLSWLHSQNLLEPTGKVLPGNGLAKPTIQLVPTTCATGAEAAAVAVFSHEGRKVPAVSRLLLADEVVLDSQFLEDLSEPALSAFLCDALSHAIEAYCSIVPSTFAKEAAVSSLAIVLDQYDAPAGHERLERLLEASYLGGLAASHCSVGVVHAFSHSVAGWGVPHSAGNAAALLAGIRANREAPALTKLAKRLGADAVEAFALKIEKIVRAASASIDREDLVARLQSPQDRASLLELMTKDACLRTNPVRLGNPELGHFLDDVESQLSQP